MREKLIHELEEERRLRLDSEKRLREVTEESELGRVQMVSLQQHFSRMEETVRTLLQNQGVLEQTAVDTVDIMKAYKEKLSEEVQKQRESLEESRLPASPTELLPAASEAGEGRDRTALLLERLRTLEEENAALAMENESQREQYERCLDEVANQVVQALLTQKDLREECIKLRTRVFDLEQQNRTLSMLFQQRVRPASDLLLQKLHSRIMDLSAADLLLETERSKTFLFSRNTDSPPHDVQLNGKAGLPVTKCVSQLSLAPLAACSYSSSEMSLSSACSEYSSGSYTWNDGRSCGKMSSLTWEKRLSLGSSAPSNICAPLEEQFPTRRKESHILEGLRKLQRRKPKASSSSSSKVSKSGEKDCMNSNEGIYSLGIKSGSKGISKPYVARAAALTAGVKKFLYDSDDADDESPHSADCRGDSVPIKEGWMYCKKLSHSVSDSLCSWEGLQDTEPSAGNSSAGTKQPPPPYNYKERPEKLMSFINSFLSGGHTSSTVFKPSLLHMEVSPNEPDFPLHLSDTEPEDLHPKVIHRTPRPSRPSLTQQLEKEPKRLSRDAATLHCLRSEQGRTQSADGRPRPFSLIKEPHMNKSQSEESIMAIFDAEGEPIELNTQQSSASSASQTELSGSKAVAGYSELAQERPVKQKGVNSKNYTVLESPEKPSGCHSMGSRGGGREGSAERLTTQPTPQRKLIKPPSNRANKVQPAPLTNDASGSKANSSKIPGRGKASPLKVSKGSSVEPTSQEKSPSSPPVKMSRFIKTPCSQSPMAAGSKLPGNRSDWGKGSSSTAPPGSPHPSRRLQDHVDYGEQPTRDRHYETSKHELRSPSPPLPPGRTTSLLIRPNYDGSPQALKTGAPSSSAPTTVRGPPPSYHPPPVPNMQHTLPYKGQDSVDLDAGYGTAIAPQKLVDKASQHLQKSSALTQTPSKGTSTRTPSKHYLPASASGYVPDHPENAPKSSKNVPPYPHSSQKGSSLQSTFTSKKGSTNENGYPQLYKASPSVPVSVQSQLPCTVEPPVGLIQPPQAVVSPTSPLTAAPNQTEKACKTRIPMGFKAFVKSTPSHKHVSSVPGKQEKDHINSVSKETVTSNASTQCERLPPPAYGTDPSSVTTITEIEGEGRSSVQDREAHSTAMLKEGEACSEKADRDGRIFSRSISVTTKPHLKPAMGMNGAKARSQSFSTNYMEKPNLNGVDAPGKVRTQIITNSGERGNSLTRQSSFVEGLQAKPSGSSGESPIRCPANRLSHYGGMTASNSHQVFPEKAFKSASKAEGSRGGGKGENMTTPPQKEARSLPLADRIGLRNSKRPAKVASHPQFETPSSPVYSPEALTPGIGGRLLSPSKAEQNMAGKVQTCGPLGGLEEGDKQASPAVSTIEEKVMMGIEENVQKGQGQEKVQASEAKQKTGPSLANWFGLRKSKLPALNGKKSDATKAKEEKKELKVTSVLGGKQTKTDKKDKKKNESPCKDSQDQTLCENGNRLSSIMDHCNIQMGQIANQIQCSTVYIGKDQFMKDLLGRRVAVKADSLTASLPGITVPQKHCGEMSGDMEISRDTATIIVTQKINMRGDNEEEPIPEATCQDHMIGSGCQMRTLDSGIGTFPLPDSFTRVNGRHIPKSESSPDRVASVPTEPDQDPPVRSPSPHVKVPSSLEYSCPHAIPGHSLSDPTVTSSHVQDFQSRVPKPSTSDGIRTRRLSQMELRTDHAADVKEKHTEKKRDAKEPNSPSDRTLRVCTYSGSSSDTKTEAESEGNSLASPQKILLSPAKTGNSADQNKEATRRSIVGKSLSIMDYYPHDVFSRLEKDQRRSVSQYSLLLKDSGSEVKAGERLTKGNQLVKTSGSAELQPGSLEASLESLNKLNLSSSAGLFPGTELGGSGVLRAGGRAGDGCRADAPPSSSSFSGKTGPDHVGGSLSDSLYDSFSSCTSQGSNDV